MESPQDRDSSVEEVIPAFHLRRTNQRSKRRLNELGSNANDNPIIAEINDVTPQLFFNIQPTEYSSTSTQRLPTLGEAPPAQKSGTASSGGGTAAPTMTVHPSYSHLFGTPQLSPVMIPYTTTSQPQSPPPMTSPQILPFSVVQSSHQTGAGGAPPQQFFRYGMVPFFQGFNGTTVTPNGGGYPPLPAPQLMSIHTLDGKPVATIPSPPPPTMGALPPPEHIITISPDISHNSGNNGTNNRRSESRQRSKKRRKSGKNKRSNRKSSKSRKSKSKKSGRRHRRSKKESSDADNATDSSANENDNSDDDKGGDSGVGSIGESMSATEEMDTSEQRLQGLIDDTDSGADSDSLSSQNDKKSRRRHRHCKKRRHRRHKKNRKKRGDISPQNTSPTVTETASNMSLSAMDCIAPSKKRRGGGGGSRKSKKKIESNANEIETIDEATSPQPSISAISFSLETGNDSYSTVRKSRKRKRVVMESSQICDKESGAITADIEMNNGGNGGMNKDSSDNNDSGKFSGDEWDGNCYREDSVSLQLQSCLFEVESQLRQLKSDAHALWKKTVKTLDTEKAKELQTLGAEDAAKRADRINHFECWKRRAENERDQDIEMQRRYLLKDYGDKLDLARIRARNHTSTVAAAASANATVMNGVTNDGNHIDDTVRAKYGRLHCRRTTPFKYHHPKLQKYYEEKAQVSEADVRRDITSMLPKMSESDQKKLESKIKLILDSISMDDIAPSDNCDSLVIDGIDEPIRAGMSISVKYENEATMIGFVYQITPNHLCLKLTPEHMTNSQRGEAETRLSDIPISDITNGRVEIHLNSSNDKSSSIE